MEKKMEIFKEMFEIWKKWKINKISDQYRVSNWLNPYGRDSRLTAEEDLNQLEAHKRMRFLDLEKLNDLIDDCKLEIKTNCNHDWTQECERGGKSYSICYKCTAYK